MTKSRVLPLNPPFRGMSSIINVFEKVGGDQPNRPEDVRVIQTLIAMAEKGNLPSQQVGVPAVTGRFDAVTGFWIFLRQVVPKQNGHPNVIVDGVVSPAHGSLYASGAAWTIVELNRVAKKISPFEYAAYMKQVSSGVA